MKIALVKHISYLHNDTSVLQKGDFRPLLKLLQQHGIQYEIVAWNDQTVKWNEYTLIIITYNVDYWKDLDGFLSFVDRVEALAPGILRNPSKVLRWNCNKKYLKELEERGIRIPRTLWLHNTINLKEVLENFSKLHAIDQLVVKNCVDAKGSSAWRCSLPLKEDDLAKVKKQLEFSEHGILVQPFLKNILCLGEWSLIYFNRRFSHAVIKRPRSNGEFRVQAIYGGSFTSIPDDDVPSSLIRFGYGVISCISEDQELPFARVDVIENDDGPVLMELEVLDPFLFLTEDIHAERLMDSLITKDSF